MLNTSFSYRLIARDLDLSLARKAATTDVARETAYFEANIGKVKSVDDLFGDQRLYAYAMKAMGLEEMTYAKALMRKVVTEGVTSATSFANRLNDSRYKAFASAFDFAQGAKASGLATTPAQLSGALDISDVFDFSGSKEASFSLTSQLDASTTRSITIVLNKDTLARPGLDLASVSGAQIVEAINARIEASGEAGLKGKVKAGLGVRNNLFFETTAYNSLSANDLSGAAYVSYPAGANRTVAVANVALSGPGRTAFDLGFGTALPLDAKAKSVTDAYLRQSLEVDAGAEDAGVRLALYFSRIAPTVSSGFGILGDDALSQVVKTVLGLPDGGSAEAIARQAAIIEEKVDVASFKDPVKLDRFIQTFTAIWDAQNNTAGDPILALFDGSSASQGLDADLLLSALQNRSRG
ncbi:MULTISPECIES: DUF1217 domain-containing protein [unclassified Methylobacterium]|uniref:DUF1217 domain-containing protein n=1 Tax=unclassified Methylobacterium TaxID=2615210 RepID=UPI0006F2F79F|nr:MULTISPECIES: DUF1217 domain-containing protein [unclassified Methylobacterium]KQP61632.1 hypothetical protein ASF39_02885 [Methylobacterium sp. Leaf108]KQT80832.1 hypothetical protein ASG59_05320 [Methylobacterium sp. Leaf466]